MMQMYNEKGYIVYEQQGCVLIFEDESSDRPMLIATIKQSQHPLSFDEVVEIYLELKKTFDRKEEIEQDYLIIATSGFEEEARMLEEFHLRLEESIEKCTTQELLPHNQLAYRSVMHAWKGNKKVAIVRATGTGKTLVATRCVQTLSPGHLLILAPSNLILEQFRKTMIETGSRVTYMTYAKLLYLTKEEIGELHPTCIVIDEFHRIGAEKWGESVQRLLEQSPKAYVLGLSATPIRYLDNARDMSDELFENNIASELTLEDAMAKRILPTPDYVCALYTMGEAFEELLKKINKSRTSAFQKSKMKSEIDIIKQNWEKSNGISTILKKHVKERSKFVVFMENIEHFNEMKEQVTQWFENAFPHRTIRDYAIHSGQKGSVNDQILDDYKRVIPSDAIELLFSINMLNEGLHAGSIDGVLLLRKTVSPTIFYQQIGRTLHANVNKKPIIFDLVNNIDHINVRFFEEKLEQAIRKEKRKREKFEIMYDVPHYQVADETMDIKRVLEEIESRIQYAWDEYYEALALYRERYGDTLVSTDNRFEGLRLGQWVSAQRTLYQHGSLSNERIRKLENIGFVWDLYEHLWEESFQTLLKFKEEHGHLIVPEDYITNEKSLGYWARAQRQAYKNKSLSQEKTKRLRGIGFDFAPFDSSWKKMYGEFVKHPNSKDKKMIAWSIQQRFLKHNGRLPLEREKALTAAGFLWEPQLEKWWHNFEKLREFHKEHGHTNVPTDDSFGIWVSAQRTLRKRNELSKDRIDALNTLQFEWDVLEANWQNAFEQVAAWKKKTGDFKVEDPALKNWISVQRQFYRNKKLRQDRIERLESIGFAWKRHDAAWDEMYNLLQAYQIENGHCKIPYKTVIDGKKLGQWYSAQKSLYKKGELTYERMEKLSEYIDNT